MTPRDCTILADRLAKHRHRISESEADVGGIRDDLALAIRVCHDLGRLLQDAANVLRTP